MAMHHYCTLFDRNYLFKGLALYRSLERHAGDFALHILCMDEVARETLARLALPRARLIPLAEIEDEALLRVKPARTPAEYCWTCTPSLPLFVLGREPGAGAVTYLDADLFFASSPEPLHAEAGDAPVVIHEHRFAPHRAKMARDVGRFNVGWVGFRGSDEGIACARWWRERCLEWCGSRSTNGKLGDQSYLDEWPARFRGVHILAHRGGGVGPWNVERYSLARGAGGAVTVDGDPLVFFHFHGLHLFDGGGTQLAPPEYDLRPEDLTLIYEPYLARLREAVDEVRGVAPDFRHGFVARPPVATRAWRSVRRAARRIRRWIGRT